MLFTNNVILMISSVSSIPNQRNDDPSLGMFGFRCSAKAVRMQYIFKAVRMQYIFCQVLYASVREGRPKIQTTLATKGEIKLVALSNQASTCSFRQRTSLVTINACVIYMCMKNCSVHTTWPIYVKWLHFGMYGQLWLLPWYFAVCSVPASMIAGEKRNLKTLKPDLECQVFLSSLNIWKCSLNPALSDFKSLEWCDTAKLHYWVEYILVTKE